VVDETALLFDTMFCSAGKRGMEIELAPEELVRLTGAVVAEIGREG
jgi:Cys-tRNA(Pro)/Cys-tRNA(Cys) deacylase